MPEASTRPDSPMTAAMRKVAFATFAFAVLALLIVSRPARPLDDFDGPFYITIAYDLDRYGVFSNGTQSLVDSTLVRPDPGMFFGPVFPLIVYAAMELDPRFAEAVRCSVEADREHRDEATCEPYTLPIRLINAFLLALGTTAVACAAQLIFRRRGVFLLAGIFTLAALAAEADLFRLVMTESAIFAIYSLFAWTSMRALRSNARVDFALTGALLGILCLTKPSFLALAPLVAATSVLYLRVWAKPPQPRALRGVLVLMLALACVLGAWATRNLLSVGKFALTEEYGSAALIERFAYDDMTAREFIQAFPYCVPGIGDLAFDLVYGTDSMHRFVYHTPGSFFHVGRDRRDTLLEEHGRLDPLIGGIIREEMRENWWRYLAVNVPLVWCGMWAGSYTSLVLLPLFAWASWRAIRAREGLFLLYAAPAVLMLAVHAAFGNHTTRYNLILIGPYAVAAAWIISLRWSSWQDARWRSQSRAPAR